MAPSFGLLRGLRFAGALREIGLPEQAILTALLFFNMGVEIGQIVFVTTALSLGGAIWWLTKVGKGREVAAIVLARSELAAYYGVGIAGAYWLYERLSVVIA